MPEAVICPGRDRKLDSSGVSSPEDLAVNERIEALKTKKATAGTAAMKSKLRIEHYQKSKRLSSLQAEIGTLLLCLQFPLGQEVSQIGWALFERLLRRYIRLRISQRALQGHPGCAESTNGEQLDYK